MTSIGIKDSAGATKLVNVHTEADGTSTINHRPNNVTQFRENCKSFTEGVRWNLTLATNDLLLVEGGTAGATWFDFSLDPFSQGTESKLTSVSKFTCAMEAVFGIHASQRTTGQELSIELVDANTAVTPPAALTISSIQQATTTLTIVTTTAHSMKVGQSFSVYGVTSDSRLNYPALTVASIVSTTSFTATAGPASTIPSVTAGPFATGSVILRSRVGWRNNGTSLILDTVTATDASFYTVCDGGAARPSGTLVGDHNAAINTTASAALSSLAFAASFVPSGETRLLFLQDRLNWSDVSTVDGTSVTTTRYTRTQMLPDTTAEYKIQFRINNNWGKTHAVGRILSAVKAGSTTANVTTDVAHGLTTGDYIAAYGVRDTTNFANITTATVVASIVSATEFTVVWPTSATATSWGGVVYRFNSANTPAILGAQSIVAQSVSRTSNVVTLTGSGTWTVSIGDIVNLHGCINTSGASLGIDGPYRVTNLVTSVLTLEPVGLTPTGADIGSTNCGGAVHKRTSLRISSVRAESYDFVKVEWSKKAASDSSNALPVAVNYANATIGVNGAAVHDAVIAGAPVRIGARALTSNYAAVASGDAADLITTLVGALIVRQDCIPEAVLTPTVVTLTNTTSTALAAAGAAGIKNYLKTFSYQNTSAIATFFNILDGSTVRKTYSAPAMMADPVFPPLDPALSTTAATALNVQAATTGANLIINAQIFQTP